MNKAALKLDQPRAEYLFLKGEYEKAIENLKKTKDRVNSNNKFFTLLFRSWMDKQWDIDMLIIAMRELELSEKRYRSCDNTQLGMSGGVVIVKDIDYKYNLATVRNVGEDLFYYTEYSNLEFY